VDYESENRQRIMDLERKVEFLLKELKLEEKEKAYIPDISPLMLEALALVRKGRKIEAIKLYREKTGTSLAEAKAIIDRLG
jgi:ribosomal protein L7/L12